MKAAPHRVYQVRDGRVVAFYVVGAGGEQELRAMHHRLMRDSGLTPGAFSGFTDRVQRIYRDNHCVRREVRQSTYTTGTVEVGALPPSERVLVRDSPRSSGRRVTAGVLATRPPGVIRGAGSVAAEPPSAPAKPDAAMGTGETNAKGGG